VIQLWTWLPADPASRPPRLSRCRQTSRHIGDHKTAIPISA
jgi:hypothetical protein